MADLGSIPEINKQSVPVPWPDQEAGTIWLAGAVGGSRSCWWQAGGRHTGTATQRQKGTFPPPPPSLPDESGAGVPSSEEEGGGQEDWEEQEEQEEEEEEEREEGEGEEMEDEEEGEEVEEEGIGLQPPWLRTRSVSSLSVRTTLQCGLGRQKLAQEISYVFSLCIEQFIFSFIFLSVLLLIFSFIHSKFKNIFLLVSFYHPMFLLVGLFLYVYFVF